MYYRNSKKNTNHNKRKLEFTEPTQPYTTIRKLDTPIRLNQIGYDIKSPTSLALNFSSLMLCTPIATQSIPST